MNRTLSLIAVCIFVGWSGAAHAQIKVVKKPVSKVGAGEEVVYNQWVSSWGLRDDAPDKYPLGIATHKTEAEAVAAAKAHIARTAGNGALAVTHYLIEGEPTVRKASTQRGGQATELLARLKEAKDAVDEAKKVKKSEASVLKATERKLGDTIKEYKDLVAQSYRQAVEAKKTLTGGVAALTDAKMREVNGAIDKYNREIQDFQSVMGRGADLEFTPLARVQPPAAKTSDPAEKTADDSSPWIVGTDWGGLSQWYSDRSGDWRSFSNGAFLISFAENGRCYIVLGDADNRTVVRSESKWRQDGDAIIVEELGYLKNVVIHFGKQTSEATSAPVLVQGDKRRVELKKNWGLKLYSPTIEYTGYRWSLVDPRQSPDHRTAKPR